VSGVFITIEGTEGVGKSTSIAFVRAYLEAAGNRVVVTREPGGTQVGERIRELVLSARAGSLSATTETLLMYAARSHHLERVIKPALREGAWVVCDRFVDATTAYQGAGRNANQEFLDDLAKHVLKGLRPDLTLLLDAPLDIGFERIRHRERDHFEQEGRDFFERVRQKYHEIAMREPERVKVIDAAQTVEGVQMSLRTALDQYTREREIA
jgi:dTMP kinase